MTGQKIDATLLVEAASQPTNLLVTFLEYCSVVSQDIKGLSTVLLSQRGISTECLCAV